MLDDRSRLALLKFMEWRSQFAPEWKDQPEEEFYTHPDFTKLLSQVGWGEHETRHIQVYDGDDGGPGVLIAIYRGEEVVHIVFEFDTQFTTIYADNKITRN